MDYSYSYSYDMGSSGLAGLLGMLAGIWIFVLVILIISLVATIMIFRKAGYAGWEAIIPFYNSVCMFNMVGMNPLLIILAFIPIANFAFLVISIIVRYKLMKCFGKSSGFAVASIFFGLICMCIVAFSKNCEYQGVV